MADRTFLWGGKSPTQLRSTEFGGRRRHDQQRLLVELELDESMYQGALRAGMQQTAPWQSETSSSRRTTYAGDTNNSRHFQPGYEQDFIAEPKPRLQSRAPRESTAKPLTERQMQQLQAKRLSSPYKLKQQVQDTRSDGVPHRYQHQRSPHNSNANSVHRAIRSPTLQQSPAQIVIESIRQNIHLRDQVMAHLQQELMGVLPLHRASHVEKNVPQRVVKLLNRMRSLALAVVEAVVYLSGELGDSDVVGVSAEHEILEQDFYGYLLQMASSDADFLACSPPLQRFFEDFEVNLTRNPFVDGLSLDSSEVLLCSCHQSSSSGALFCSASSSSTSLLRLLTHKLETFALQTQRYLQGWQILPGERVAAALLHLMDLETRYNSVRMIPRYLQSHGDNRRHLHQHRGLENTPYGYGTFEDERIQQSDRQDSRLSFIGGHHDKSRSEKTVVEAWAGSPTLKTPAKLDSQPPSEGILALNVPDQLLPSTTSNASARRSSKNEGTRSASPSASAWTPISSSPESGSARKNNSNLDSAAQPASSIPRSARKMPAETVDTGSGEEGDNVELTHVVLPLPPLDTAALAKTSSRSNQSERPASKKRSRNFDEKYDHHSTYLDVQMSKLTTPTAATCTSEKDQIPITKRSVSTLLSRSTRDETIQVYEEGLGNLVSVRRLPIQVLTKDEPQRVVPSPIITEADFSESVEQERDNSIEPLTSLRNTGDNWINVEAAPTTEKEIESSVEYGVENDAEVNDDRYECDFEYSSNEALSSIAMALQMLPSFSFSNTESTLSDEVLKPEEAIPPNEAESMNSSRSEGVEADHIEGELLPERAAIPLSAGESPARTSRSEAIVSMESIVSELGSAEQRAEVPTPEDDEYAYSSSSAVSNIAMALSLLPNVWKDDAFTVLEDESEHLTESLVGVDSPRINSYQSISEAHSPFEDAVHFNSVEPAVDDMTAYFSLSSFHSNVPTMVSDHMMHSFPTSSRTSKPTTTSDQVAYSSPPSSCYGASSMANGDMISASSRSNASTMINDKVIPPLPASSRTRTTTSERAVYSSPTSSRSNAPTMISDHVMNSLPASSRSNARTLVIEQEVHSPLASFRTNISATTSYQGDDESEPSEFNRIFSLCRDIQVAAFDRSHWVSQREVEDHILSVAQPYSSLMGYSSPTIPVVNAPQYLERELKMLRRNFTYWKEACAELKRAKQVVRRAVAWRKIKQFIYHHHQRRLQARRDEDHRVRLIAACRIQRNWRIYRHHQNVARRKSAFRLIHMRFYRMLFFVGISYRRRQREYAKEKVVRWWRHQRSRIKKNKQRQEKLARERERRARALKDIQKFLKEILLRRKLKAAQEMAKNILFKEQLKWTKAKRDVERSMKLNSKHRRELIRDMNVRLAELDLRWKTSEEERLQLLTHHERVVQQQQHAVEVRRRRLAVMKIQMFFRVCHLHKKLQRVEMEKKQFALKLHKEVLAKEKLGIEAQKRVGKTRTQVRVLERKLDRMSQQALQIDARHRKIVQDHQTRERSSDERAARQKIKGFIDARVLFKRAESEKLQLLLKQAHLQAEMMEIELMSIEDQLEQRRTATSIASELQQRLSNLEARSEALLKAKDQLAAEKELEALQAAALVKNRRVETSMQVIASWVSGHMRLSKLKKEKAAICASAAREMKEEKRRQREEIEVKTREVASIKASSLMHQRISQHRNHRAVGMIRMQQQQKSAQDKVIADRTRAQLVQVIISVKLLAECESSEGISQALDSVARFHKAFEHKSARLKYLRFMNCARKIQRAWCRWTYHQRIKRQDLALSQLKEAKQRQALARKLQAWWRKWAQEQQCRREQQRVFAVQLEMIRTRANVRKIQSAWKRWIIHERARRREQQLVFDAHLKVIHDRSNVKKIQRVWRRWVTRERERSRERHNAHLETIRMRASARKVRSAWREWVIRERSRQERVAFSAHLEAIRIRANVRKIQGVWRRWIIRERERRSQQQQDFKVHLEAIRVRANVRKIQGAWSRWVVRERERRHQQQLLFDAHLEAIRVRANVRKIQGVWRCWVIRERERRNEQQRVFNRHLETIRTRANVRKIQGAWRRWVKREHYRRCQQQQAFDAHLEALRARANARKIQAVWRRWVQCNQEQREKRRVQRLVFSSAVRIQKWWRNWQRQQQAKTERIRILCEASAQVIQRRWMRWQQWRRAAKENKYLQIQREACARKLQKIWRQYHEWTRRRELSARRIQEHLEKRQKEKVEAERVQKTQLLALILIQQNWRSWQCKLNYEKENTRKRHRLQIMSARIQRACYQWWQRRIVEKQAEMEHCEEDEQLQQEYLVQTQHASSVKIQRNWGNRQHRRKMERERIQHEHHMSALKIQTLWLKWHHEQQEDLEKDRIRQEQYESSLKIQRSWGISHRRQKVAHERLRHKQNLSALKIQKHWRRRRHLRLEQRHRKKSNGADPKTSRTSSTAELEAEGAPGLKPDPVHLQHIEQQRQLKLDAIKHRSCGRFIARAVNKYHQSRRVNSAATRIEAIWKGKLCRMQYLDALEFKRAEEARQYRLMISVFATKVQTCWRTWNTGVRKVKRAPVKDDELRLIHEAKVIERKVLVAKRSFAAKRIQRAIVSRRKLKDDKQEVVITKEKVLEHEELTDKALDTEPVESLENDEPVIDLLEPMETPEEYTIRADVESTVEDWSHRELPHILTRSVNQILFYHDAASVLQKFVREYQKRQRMHFYFQSSFATTTSLEPGNSDGEMSGGYFHFYFKRASAWLEWDSSKSNGHVASRMDSNQVLSPLRLRFDSQMTRKLLQLFEPSEEYLTSETLQVLQELAADAWPILRSPVCLQDNDNLRLELCYHDVDEMELFRSVALLRQMGQRHAQIRRQQLLEIDTSFKDAPATLPSPIAKSTPSSPSKKEVTIFTAVENASVEDATFLQQRGADIGAVDPKMQRSVLHMLSFSKESYRSRVEMLEFLLSCDANLNVNAVDCNGDTPLMLYASLGHLNFMQKLLAHGADVQMTNRKGQNVLHRACEDDQVEVCGFLQQLMMKDSIAENIIPIETISALVPAALSLHTPDNAGRYPVHCLTEKGFVECAKQLVVPTEVNYEWNRMLQAQGNSQGRTPLHLAVLTHDTAMTAFLLTPGGGSNVNAFDDLHRSPVHYAVESPAALPIIARLVQHGVNLNVADERGDTPLHWAAFSGRAAVAQNLLALGADPTLVNSDWETPAQIAAAYGQLDCMRLLLQGQRRYGTTSAVESKEQQQQPALARPASEKTALQRLEEAVNHLHEKQAASQSYHANDEGTDLDAAVGENEGAPGAPLADQSHGGYWEELHQDVQLVEESGQFSSEDEEDLLFGHDDDF